MEQTPPITRERLVKLGLALPITLVLAAGGRVGSAGAAPLVTATLRATPACGDNEEPTPEQTEGPYYMPGSPRRASLVTPGMKGTKLLLTGTVLTTGCKPVARALLDFWQADANGGYDNRGFRLRGHQFTDARGRYRLVTVVPGLYTGRTRHIHVKVQAPGRAVLTTQLYFPGELQNGADGIFSPELVLRNMRRAGGRWTARFDFVLDPA